MASLSTSSTSKIGLILGIFLFTSSFAFAHGLATTQSALEGDYLIQLEYDTVGNVNAGESTYFSFEMLNPDSKESIDFDRIFVRVIKKNGPVAFVGNLFPLEVSGVESARTRIYLPDEGQYDFILEYYKEETKLSEHTFTLEIDPPYALGSQSGFAQSNGWFKYSWVISLIIGIITGAFLAKSQKTQ